jgi:hypothetical protein
MKSTIIFIFLLTNFIYGQNRQEYSADTKAILSKLDSLLNRDAQLEFRTVGDGGKLSEKFKLYVKLVKYATDKELLDALNNSKESVSIRGYAYMAYAYKCDSEKKKEQTLNYKFNLHTLNGCIGHDMSFFEFKTYIRKRNIYNPEPKSFVIDSNEKKAILNENKIRKEQGEPLRKE